MDVVDLHSGHHVVLVDEEAELSELNVRDLLCCTFDLNKVRVFADSQYQKTMFYLSSEQQSLAKLKPLRYGAGV